MTNRINELWRSLSHLPLNLFSEMNGGAAGFMFAPAANTMNDLTASIAMSFLCCKVWRAAFWRSSEALVGLQATYFNILNPCFILLHVQIFTYFFIEVTYTYCIICMYVF